MQSCVYRVIKTNWRQRWIDSRGWATNNEMCCCFHRHRILCRHFSTTDNKWCEISFITFSLLSFLFFWQVWIFGDLWCPIWLALDVWMCTASILNLCAISLDRYVAVTRPVTYPSIMSTKRAKMLVAGVWVLSFVICLPQLIGLKQNHKVGFYNKLLLSHSHTLLVHVPYTSTPYTATTILVAAIYRLTFAFGPLFCSANAS